MKFDSKKPDEMISEAKEYYEKAKSKHDSFRAAAARSGKQYDTGLTGANYESMGEGAKMVYNFTRELIDAQVTTDIPMPLVTPRIKTPENEQRARTITAMLRAEIDRMPFELHNDLLERITRTDGGAVSVIEWDNTKVTHNYNGELDVKIVTASEFVPQPGIYNQDEMDYWFIVKEDTKAHIKTKYGKDVEDEGSNPSQDKDTTNDELTTLILMFYKNDKGGIGHIAWAGATLLLDVDNYYARNDKICESCQRAYAGTKECICGGTKWVTRNRDGEVLEQDYTKSDGNVISASNIAGIDELGNPLIENRTIPYYEIKSPPIAIRKNASKSNTLFGYSDCDTIKSLQEEANKATTKIADKLANSGYIFTKPDNLSGFELSNKMGKVLSIASPDQLTMLKAIAFEFNSQQDYVVVQNSYQFAKSCLAVTDAYQGKSNYAGESGRAREALISQSAGIQRAVNVLKNAFYSDLYQKMFYMMLAFSDEPRTYTVKDGKGKEQSEVFSRYDFLEDDNGNLYYEDNFLFSVDETGINPNNRSEYIRNVKEEFAAGTFGNPQDPETILMYWTVLESVGYPVAGTMVEHWQRKVEQAQSMQGMQGQAPLDGETQQSGLPPEIMQAVQQLIAEGMPPEQAVQQIMQQIGGGEQDGYMPEMSVPNVY